jgi:hypothetical protein
MKNISCFFYSTSYRFKAAAVAFKLQSYLIWDIFLYFLLLLHLFFASLRKLHTAFPQLSLSFFHCLNYKLLGNIFTASTQKYLHNFFLLSICFSSSSCHVFTVSFQCECTTKCLFHPVRFLLCNFYFTVPCRKKCLLVVPSFRFSGAFLAL